MMSLKFSKAVAISSGVGYTSFRAYH
jgi:hypothetical protein